MDQYLSNSSRKRIRENKNDEFEVDNVAGPSSSCETDSNYNKMQNYLLDGKFYKIISVEGSKMSVSCQTCSKKIIPYSNSSRNLLSQYKVSVSLYYSENIFKFNIN